MESLQTWYLGLDTNLQVYWAIAMISSIIFLVQLVLTLIGIGGDADFDVDTDFDGDTTDFGGLSLFSVRAAVNFFLGFGWAGICLWGHIGNIFLLYVLSAAIGLALALLCIFLMKKMKRLESNGAFRLQDTVCKTCTVYLRIPAERARPGKVQISINGPIHEINALTDGAEIPTGAMVRIVSVIDSAAVLVERV